MPLSPPSGYDPNSLIPFVGFATRLGAGPRTAPYNRSILIVANKIESNIVRTVDGVTYTTAAGTLALATPTFCGSREDADLYAGCGSPAALMYRAIYAVYRRASVYLSLVAENGSAVKATAVLLFAGTPTTSGVARLMVAGRSIAEVTISTASTPTTIATAIATAVNQQTHWPVTATVSAGTLTLTAKSGGTRGNNIPFEVEVTATGVTCAVNGGSAAAKTAARLGGGTGVDGAGADDVTAALDAAKSGRWMIVLDADDATNWTALRTHLNTYATITERKRSQAVVALTNASVGTCVTRAQAQNAYRLQIAFERDASSGGAVDPAIRSTGEIAAALAAARLYGDGIVQGGTVRGELAYAAANLNGVQLAGITEPLTQAARLSDAEKQQLLYAGVSPIVPSLKNPGFAEVVRCVTSYSLDGSGNPTDAVRDTSKVTVTDYAAERFESRILTEFPNKNLGEEPENPGQAPRHEDVIFPSMVSCSLKDEASKMQDEGLLVKTAINEDDFQLLIAEIPVSVIPHFHALAGTISEVGV
jgi:phage tail sheath gpL-like